jgi:TrmH family RNA methyltransferase
VAVLTSVRNPSVAAAIRLHRRSSRDRSRLFIVEGALGVSEALDSGHLRRLFTTDPLSPVSVNAGQRGTEVVHVSEAVMKKIASTVTPQPEVGIADYVDVPIAGLPLGGCRVVLHAVRDPGNAGTVLRSADAAGAGAVLFGGDSVDVYNQKTVRASAGSIFHIPVVRRAATIEAIEACRSDGFRVLAMDAGGAESLYGTDLSRPVAFVFGNEASGLPQEVVSRADATVRVPHPGRAESLNLAAAATVTLFEWSRRLAGRGHALGPLIAAAAHDIRSPLTAMKGFGYALEKRWHTMTDEQRALMLGGIVHDADRMDQILRQLVDAARIAAGSLEPLPEQTDIRDIVETIAAGASRDPEHPAVRFEGDPGPFFVDPSRLRTSIASFVEALVWHAPGDGEVVVRSEGGSDSLHLWASRTGTDLDADAAESLFIPREPGSGAGSKIGLFVARGVAEAQGGRAWASVSSGELSLHLELPLGL